jgi:hypothetical protein
MFPGLSPRIGSGREGRKKPETQAKIVVFEGSTPLELSKASRKVKMSSMPHDAIFGKMPTGIERKWMGPGIYVDEYFRNGMVYSLPRQL